MYVGVCDDDKFAKLNAHMSSKYLLGHQLFRKEDYLTGLTITCKVRKFVLLLVQDQRQLRWLLSFKNCRRMIILTSRYV